MASKDIGKKISDEETAGDIANGSGNSFHSRVAVMMRSLGWDVLISPYYIDASTDKPREIDLIAEKVIRVDPIRNFNTLRVRLHIECKYVNQVAVFWFEDRDVKRTVALIEALAPFTERNTSIQQHHYLAGRSQAAKLFASSAKGNDDGDIIFRAVNQCLNGFIFNRHRHIVTPAHKHEQLIHTIEYPLIVFNSFERLFRTPIGDPSRCERIVDNFQLEVNYAYKNPSGADQSDFFLVDMIDVNRSQQFFDLLEAEIVAATYILQRPGFS